MAEEKLTGEERKVPHQISRRRFLLGSGVAVGSAVVAGVTGATVAPATAEASGVAAAGPTAAAQTAGEQVPVAPAVGHVVVDPKYCCECRTCELACSTAHGNTVNPRVAGIRIGREELASILALPMTCRQCEAANCMAACPTGALMLDPGTNAKFINQSKCVGCQSCVQACPFAVAEQSRVVYNPVTQTCFKCDLCGGDPLCVKLCPTFALSFEKGAN